jgi:hypothetical protein
VLREGQLEPTGYTGLLGNQTLQVSKFLRKFFLGGGGC